MKAVSQLNVLNWKLAAFGELILLSKDSKVALRCWANYDGEHEQRCPRGPIDEAKPDRWRAQKPPVSDLLMYPRTRNAQFRVSRRRWWLSPGVRRPWPPARRLASLLANSPGNTGPQRYTTAQVGHAAENP